MHRIHILISLFLVLSAVTLFAGLQINNPDMVTMGVMAGWFFSVIATIMGFIIVVLFIIRMFSGKAVSLLRHSWLGIVNGMASVLVSWLIISGAI